MPTRNWSNHELARLEQVVVAWKEAYLSQAGPGEGWGFLCDDFWEDIQTFMYPYLSRLCLVQALEKDEMQVFLRYCSEEVEDLRRRIEEKSHAGEV